MMVARTPPYSSERSLSAPDAQMVAVLATSNTATMAIAKVSFIGVGRFG